MLENFERIDQLFAQNLSRNPLIQLILMRVLFAFRSGHLFCSVNKEEEELLFSTALIGNFLYLEEGKLFLARNYLALKACFEQIERIESSSLKEANFLSDGAFLEQVKRQAFTILTGGPGTGKSTLIAQLATSCRDFSVVIATPTGKSAQRIKEVVPDSLVMTLHKLLAIFRNYPFLPYDLIIIDECSMVDLQLFLKLLGKIPNGSRIILVGDHHQLPPIEGCGFFRTLVESKHEQTMTLQKVYRTSNLSLLNVAKEIREGKLPATLPMPSLEELVSSYFFNFYDKNFTLKTVAIRLQESQILTPFKKGQFGCDNLNAKFLELAEKKNISMLPIIITKNDEFAKVANGDKGVLYENSIYLADNRVVSKYRVQFQLAFALTVHKSQGSEVDELVLLLPKGSVYFGRELMYTAVTRAKKKMIIYSEN